MSCKEVFIILALQSFNPAFGQVGCITENVVVSNEGNLPVKDAVENSDMNADFAKNAFYKEMKSFEHVDFTSICLLEQQLNFDFTLTDYHSPDPQAANASLSSELIKFFRSVYNGQHRNLKL